MAKVIDVSNSGGQVIVLGGALTLPTNSYDVSSPSAGSLRYNTTSGNMELYTGGTWTPIEGSATPSYTSITTGNLTVSGNASIAGALTSDVIISMAASGAVGDGTTDDTSAIQSFLNAHPGRTIVLPYGKFYYIGSANLTIPDGTCLVGAGDPFTSWGTAVGPFAGSGFYLSPDYSIVLTHGNELRKLKIFRQGLLANPTATDVNNAVAQWGNDAIFLQTTAATTTGKILTFASTTGISVGMPVQGFNIPNGATVASVTSTTATLSMEVLNPSEGGGTAPFGVYSGSTVRFGTSIAILLQGNGGSVVSSANLLEDLFIVGFNTAIYAGCGDYTVQRGWIDCYNGIICNNAGDQWYANEVRLEPWYSLGTDTSSWARPGTAFWLGPGSTGGYLMSTFAFCWKYAYIVDGSAGIALRNCQCEDGANQSNSLGVQLLNSPEVIIQNGIVSGYDACFYVQNYNAGTGTSFPQILNVYTIGKATSAFNAHYVLGANTQGKIINPQVNSNGIQLVSVQENCTGPWDIIDPCFPGGSPEIEAIIDGTNSTAATAVRWIGSAFNQAFKLSPVTNDATGGNVRGAGSIDLQVTGARSAATQVASGGEAVIVGGYGNIASANWTVAGGKLNQAIGESSTAFGYNNILSGRFSAAPGGSATTDRGRDGCLVWGSNEFNANGAQQVSIMVLTANTTDATATKMTTDGNAATGNTICAITDNTVYSVDVRIAAIVRTGTAGYATWVANGMLLTRGTGAASVALVGGGTLTAANNSGTITGWVVSVAADTTNGGLGVTVTGAASTNIGWVATVMATEVM